MITRAKNLPFSIASGEALRFGGGSISFLYLSEVSEGADLYLRSPQAEMPLIVGRRVEFGSPESGTIEIENRGGGAVSGVLFMGSGEVRDSTVVGTVSISGPVTVANPEEMHPGNPALTLSGMEYAGATSVSPGAAQYGAAQIYNPLGSGIRCVVKEVHLSTPGAATMAGYLRRYDTPLSDALVLSGTNKLDASASLAELRRESSGALITGAGSFGYASCTPYETNHDMLSTGDSPFILEEGEGIIVNVSAANQPIYGTFSWAEM